MKLLVAILVICIAVSAVSSLKCYECITYEGKRDASCPVVTCPKDYNLCTTTKYTPIPSVQTQDCYYKEDNGTNYRGTASTTVFGTNCISWDSGNLTYNSKDYPNRGLGDHNYCRNPDGDLGPWCYTSAQSDYALCDVPECFPHIIKVEEVACGWDARQSCDPGKLGEKCRTTCTSDLCNKPSAEGDPAESNNEKGKARLVNTERETKNQATSLFLSDKGENRENGAKTTYPALATLSIMIMYSLSVLISV